MSTTQENLEERIVRIRKRDEEIEKKHRAAEEDRLLALKHNAMVKTKSPTDDDWPKGHKYDSLDFTYDQNEQQDNDKMSKKSEKEKFAPKLGREYKKFPDGSGPPPDPTYNFLKDAERDGITEKITGNEKKDWRQSNGGNNNSRNKNGLNNSFRGRNSKQRNGNNTGGGGGGNRYPKHDEYGSWKNERDRIDESRIGRQKSGDGKWRREWDTDKNNDDNNDISSQMEKTFVTDPRQVQQQQQPFHMQNHQMQPVQQQQHLIHVHRDHQPEQLSPPSQHQHQQQQLHFQPRSPTHNMMRPIQPTQHTTETPMEKRGNIMVSVSQDGEVKSVKFQSTKAIGTGRVGPRQNSKPQFSIQKDAFPTVTQYQPDNAPYFVAPVMPISPRRLGPSLQDRLNRHRQPQQQNNSFEGKTNASTASSENAQITVGF